MSRLANTPAIAGLLAGLAAAALASAPVHAHDWYENQQSVEGDRCCGGNECGPLADGDVVEVRGGFLIRSLGITVPYWRERPSPDGRYHACVWWTPGQEVRCFFGPMPAS